MGRFRGGVRSGDLAPPPPPPPFLSVIFKEFSENFIFLQTIRSFLPRMLERNKGHIVNITSLAGSFPTANLTDYCASKFGATGLNHSLALELHDMGRDDIKLTCVQPYTVNTGLVWHPQSR